MRTVTDFNYKEFFKPKTEWYIDYPWFLKNIEGNVVLDTGFISHNMITKVLCDYGFTVYGADRGNWKYVWRADNFEYKQCELLDLPFDDSFFDVVFSPSLLEHLGLGHYGGGFAVDGDLVGIKHFSRVLKNGGVILAQIPFGIPYIVNNSKGKPFYRVYDTNRINRLFDGFEIEDENYVVCEVHGWLEVSKSLASKVGYKAGFPKCLLRIKARKCTT